MNGSNLQPAFPTIKALLAITCAAIIIGYGALWVVPQLAQGPHVSTVVTLTTFLVWLASIIGITPVVMLGRLGVMPTVYGYFAGMFARLMLCMGAYLVVTTQFTQFDQPMAWTLAMTYMPLLMVEVAFVGRYLWQKDFLTTTMNNTQSPATTHPSNRSADNTATT